MPGRLFKAVPAEFAILPYLRKGAVLIVEDRCQRLALLLIDNGHQDLFRRQRRIQPLESSGQLHRSVHFLHALHAQQRAGDLSLRQGEQYRQRRNVDAVLLPADVGGIPTGLLELVACRMPRRRTGLRQQSHRQRCRRHQCDALAAAEFRETHLLHKLLLLPDAGEVEVVRPGNVGGAAAHPLAVAVAAASAATDAAAASAASSAGLVGRNQGPIGIGAQADRRRRFERQRTRRRGRGGDEQTHIVQIGVSVGQGLVKHKGRGIVAPSPPDGRSDEDVALDLERIARDANRLGPTAGFDFEEGRDGLV
mmetsp:Transcript_19931/g.57244  ORF Transcript_19931/g.57244 Transcript_19931/m.57244 type:complete len:308 (+) Transcript_19931:579-1502(+)